MGQFSVEIWPLDGSVLGGTQHGPRLSPVRPMAGRLRQHARLRCQGLRRGDPRGTQPDQVRRWGKAVADPVGRGPDQRLRREARRQTSRAAGAGLGGAGSGIVHERPGCRRRLRGRRSPRCSPSTPPALWLSVPATWPPTRARRWWRSCRGRAERPSPLRFRCPACRIMAQTGRTWWIRSSTPRAARWPRCPRGVVSPIAARARPGCGATARSK